MPSPQGFAYRQYGSSNRQLVDFEGLALVTMTTKQLRQEKVDKQSEI
jgi:hypothetical protein